ncbi:hypothetical protein G210_5689 [Candida maltosa Xu316]|uniref:Uncharacterized protein n=1 Tax=Candida maltosa (strain Xu316) TaxID=1245528 RepID=M3K6S3_CANMX|nr:hypothetical protein G210_5689 [Candida maltosa Xu316]
MLAQEQQPQQQSKKTNRYKKRNNNNNNSNNNNSNGQRYHQPELRTLPSGAPVNFGHSSTNNNNSSHHNHHHKKSSSSSGINNREKLTASPTLPNGSKPNFQPVSSTKSSPVSQNTSPSSANSRPQYSLPDGRKPNFFNNNSQPSSTSNNHFRTYYNNPNTKAIKEKKLENGADIYAGGSFHSSPDAFKLPKPSFKSK